jgi:hypothetical protein
LGTSGFAERNEELTMRVRLLGGVQDQQQAQQQRENQARQKQHCSWQHTDLKPLLKARKVEYVTARKFFGNVLSRSVNRLGAVKPVGTASVP